MGDMLTRRNVNTALLSAAMTLASPGCLVARRGSRLFDFAVAGGWYHGLKDVRASVRIGERWALRPEPDNPHDLFAVAVLRGVDETRMGYVPRGASEPIARLVGAGAILEAEVVGRLTFASAREVPDDLVWTGFTEGDPRVRLLVRDASPWH